MTVSYTEKDGALTIELFGELGHHEAIDAMENIVGIYESSMPNEVVLDMGGVSFMDSSGIAVVMQARNICLPDRVPLAVRDVPKQAMKVLAAAGINKVVRFI